MNLNRKRTIRRKVYPHSTCIIFYQHTPDPWEIRRWCVDTELEVLIDSIRPGFRYNFKKQSDLTLFLLKWGEHTREYHE
jgi:hypothetical protein